MAGPGGPCRPGSLAAQFLNCSKRVKLNALILAVALGFECGAWAQSSKAERDLFAQTRTWAEKGDAEAQLRLASMYASGVGVTKDYGKAAKWHRKAAEQENRLAEYELGLDYAKGLGVKPDAEEAANWFLRAANHGLVEAECEVGLCFLRGTGVRESGVEAVNWFRKGAAQGHGPSEYQLGQCYFEGKGVAKDITEGLRWTRLAAGRGNPLAQYRLGLCYQKGEAVPKDYVEAYKWFNLAAAQDDEHATQIRVDIAKIETFMSAEDIARGQRLARDFSPEMTNGTGTASDSRPGGYVLVNAADAAGDIFVDQAFAGNPPAKLKLAAGKHVIEMKKAGYKDYRREITVTEGSQVNLNIALEKE
jgi:TPR repeat protein